MSTDNANPLRPEGSRGDSMLLAVSWPSACGSLHQPDPRIAYPSKDQRSRSSLRVCQLIASLSIPVAGECCCSEYHCPASTLSICPIDPSLSNPSEPHCLVQSVLLQAQLAPFHEKYVFHAKLSCLRPQAFFVYLMIPIVFPLCFAEVHYSLDLTAPSRTHLNYRPTLE